MNSIIEAQQEYFDQHWWPQSLIGLPITALVYVPAWKRDVAKEKKDMEACIRWNKQHRDNRKAEMWDQKMKLPPKTP
jgi:hypothetical protein